MTHARVTSGIRVFEPFEPSIRDLEQGPAGLVYLLTDESDGELVLIEPALDAAAGAAP